MEKSTFVSSFTCLCFAKSRGNRKQFYLEKGVAKRTRRLTNHHLVTARHLFTLKNVIVLNVLLSVFARWVFLLNKATKKIKLSRAWALYLETVRCCWNLLGFPCLLCTIFTVCLVTNRFSGSIVCLGIADPTSTTVSISFLKTQTLQQKPIMLVRRVTQRLASSSLAAFKMQNGTAPRRTKVLTMETLNPNIKTMEYAVRGPIVTRAAEIEKELEQVGWDRLKLKLVFGYMKVYKTMFMLCYHVNNLDYGI